MEFVTSVNEGGFKEVGYDFVLVSIDEPRLEVDSLNIRCLVVVAVFVGTFIE